ncbi:hypothetical protein L6164_000833 [Bauhinia variegata]|uniref:Uncharacterized protein n=1 Tax=Bauhinia variegata TaxID=167791 RepID=A0ACB9Q7P8_BAUVA|nr:hypothetical protein L6164_000833 [Bauhinia variegata]
MTPPVVETLTAYALLITAASAAGYSNHTVGGKLGWFFNATTNTSATNYTAWAAAQTFALGDYLIFNTNSNQTVIQTYNQTTLRSCSADDSDNGTFQYNGGITNFGEALTIAFPLTIEGPNYYFSDAGDGIQCQHGLAFQINVTHGLGLPPSLNQPPPPPYIAPPSPDTAESPLGTVLFPPPNDAVASHYDVRWALYCFVAVLIFLR